MCKACMGVKQNKSCWKQLDDDFIYYQTDYEVKASNLIIKNIVTLESKEYNIVPIRLGLLNKQKLYLNIIIVTSKQIIIAKFNKINLDLKIYYKICHKNLFDYRQISEIVNNLLQIQQHKCLVQLSRNKLIRKYSGKLKGNYNLIQQGLIKRMQLNQLSAGVEEVFQKIFKIQFIKQYVLKKAGDFLILKIKDVFKNNSYERIKDYFINEDFIIKGQGKYGSIYSDSQESLELIKQFDNIIYAVFKQNDEYKLYEIKGEQERELICSIIGKKLKKPILLRKHLILTDQDVFPIIKGLDKEIKN